MVPEKQDKIRAWKLYCSVCHLRFLPGLDGACRTVGCNSRLAAVRRGDTQPARKQRAAADTEIIEPIEDRKKRLRVFKPYCAAERVELYRRAWGPSRTAIGTWAAAAISDREKLIDQHKAVVEAIAGTLLRGGQNAAIEKGDLLQVGYAAMIRTIDLPPTGDLPLEKRIARACRTATLRFILEEIRERRYAQQGWAKAIRDNREVFGRHSAEKYMRGEEQATEAGEQTAEAEEQIAKVAGEQPAGEFIYGDWLRGFVSVFHKIYRHHIDEIAGCDLPRELAEIAHGIGYHFKEVEGDSPFPHGRRDCIRPVVECLRGFRLRRFRAQIAPGTYIEAWAELLPPQRHSIRPRSGGDYRGLFWPEGRPFLMREARESRPATAEDTVVPVPRFVILRPSARAETQAATTGGELRSRPITLTSSHENRPVATSFRFVWQGNAIVAIDDNLGGRWARRKAGDSEWRRSQPGRHAKFTTSTTPPDGSIGIDDWREGMKDLIRI